MNLIKKTFVQAIDEKRKLLIPFVTAGYPSIELTVPILHRLVDSGADILEIGIPFSDPIADGITIQHSSEQALLQGINLEKIYTLIKKFRKQDRDTAIVVMCYLNSLEARDSKRVIRNFADAGVNGLIVVDMPPEEGAIIRKACQEVGLDLIFLLSPTTTEDRMRYIDSMASGFLYYVALKGVTGSSLPNIKELSQRVGSVTQQVQLPLVVGFGIKNTSVAVAIAEHCHGIVIGSALIDIIRSNIGKSEPVLLNVVGNFITDFRTALDA